MSASASHLYQRCIGDTKSKRLHTATLEHKGVELTCTYTNANDYSTSADYEPETHIVSVTVGRDAVDVSRLVDIDALEYELDQQLAGKV